MDNVAQYMTTEEVATHCRVSQKTVRRWVKDGLLQPSRLPGRMLFRRDAVEALLDPERRNGPEGCVVDGCDGGEDHGYLTGDITQEAIIDGVLWTADYETGSLIPHREFVDEEPMASWIHVPGLSEKLPLALHFSRHLYEMASRCSACGSEWAWKDTAGTVRCLACEPVTDDSLPNVDAVLKMCGEAGDDETVEPGIREFAKVS